MKYLLSLFVLVLFLSADNPPPTSHEGLKVLSWNVYMLPMKLPSPKVKTGQQERTDSIMKLLNNSDYDILVLQEVFDKRIRRRFRAELADEFPYRYGPAFVGKGIKTNSGLFVASRYPMTVIDSIRFEECKGVDCSGRKGALMIEVEKDGITYQLMNTHMNSGGGQKFRDVRLKQYVQLYNDLIKKYEKPGVVQLLCGDFNTRKREWHYYEEMLKRLDCQDGDVTNERKLTFDDLNNSLIKKEIEISVLDYILLRQNGVRIKNMERRIQTFRANWHKKGKHTDLSDHYAMEMHIVLGK